eukprot:6631941-Prorocentrum_lima.AAC.1
MEVCGGPPGSGVAWSHGGSPPFGPADAGAPPRSCEEHQWALATQNPARYKRRQRRPWADTC